MMIALRRSQMPSTPTVNPGLLLRRGMHAWSQNNAGKDKAMLIDRVATVVPDAAYGWAYDRWRRITTDADATEATKRFVSTEMSLLGRLYIGLTRDNALESGISVNHAWGMPMIPGSALKGISRQIVKHTTLDGQTDAITHLFGSDDDAAPECGAVVFHDAWWIPDADAKPFVAEVVTTHHTGYYKQGMEHATDFDSPIPAPQIAAQGRFRFVVEGDPAWCRLAMALLKHALTRHGVGGKTTSGYGLFEERATDARKAKDGQS
jgi:CRISPR-associated protein Cmr6